MRRRARARSRGAEGLDGVSEGANHRDTRRVTDRSHGAQVKAQGENIGMSLSIERMCM